MDVRRVQGPFRSRPVLGGDAELGQNVLRSFLLNVHCRPAAPGMVCQEVSQGIVTLHPHAATAVTRVCSLSIKQGPTYAFPFLDLARLERALGLYRPSSAAVQRQTPHWE